MAAAIPTPPAAGSPPAKKSKKKLIVLLLSGVLIAGGGAGGYWYFVQRDQPVDPAAVAQKKIRKPLFTPLEAFTVNLKDGDVDRFAQIGVTLQIEDSTIDVALKDQLPAVRNNILLLLASTQAQELLTPEGKEKLANQIAVQAALAIGVDMRPAPSAATGAAQAQAPENPIKGVLFSQFIIQ